MTSKREIETANTIEIPIPSAFPVGKTGKVAKAAAAGLGSAGIIAAMVIYYLLTCVTDNAAEIQSVKGEMQSIRPVLTELKEGQRELSQEIGVVNKSLGRIEGYIARDRDR